MGHLHFEKYENRRQKIIASKCMQGSILDLAYAQAPNPHIDGICTTGIDLNENNTEVRYAREICGDICNLDRIIEGELFANIIAGEIIEHLENPYEFLRSLNQFLEPNGKLILSTPNVISWPVILFEIFCSRRCFYTTEHKYYFSPRWVTRILEGSGYRLVEASSVGLWSPILVMPCPVPLSYQVVYVAEREDER